MDAKAPKTTVSMKEAKNRLTELARLAESGMTVTITRHGKPVADIVPHKPKGGIDWEAGRKFVEDYKRKHGVDTLFGPIPEDFDAPLPEDFLLRPLP
jgi:prevent-host-death family protein